MGFFAGIGDRIVGAPSILAADCARLAEELEAARAGGAGLVHFDVMDNRFVPNLTFGPAVAASLVEATDLPLDVHLETEDPDSLIPAFLEAGTASITVHVEAAAHLHRTLTTIREGGAEAGVALNPTTPPELIGWALPYADYVLVMSVDPGFGGQAFISEMVEKVRRLRAMTDAPVGVDGGIDARTAPTMVEAGARVLVAGSSVFGAGDPEAGMREVLKAGRDTLRRGGE